MAATQVQQARWGGTRRRAAWAGLLFVLPWLLSLLLFTVYPVLTTLYLSFTDYNIVQPPRWIGVQNYRTMFTADPAFWTSVGNSAYYALLAVPLGLAGALGLAMLLHTRAPGMGVYRTIIVLPVLVPPVASTIIFIAHVRSRERAYQHRAPAGWTARSGLVDRPDLVETGADPPEPVGARRQRPDLSGRPARDTARRSWTRPPSMVPDPGSASGMSRCRC